MRVLGLLVVVFLMLGLAGATIGHLPSSAYAADPNDLCSLLPGGYAFVGGSPDTKGVYPPVKGTSTKCFFALKEPKTTAFGGVGLSGSIEKTPANSGVVNGIIANLKESSTNPVTGPVPGLGEYSQETSFTRFTAGWYHIAFYRGNYLVSLGQAYYPGGFTDQRGMVKPIAQAIDQNLKSAAVPLGPTVTPTVPKPPPAPGCTATNVPIDCSLSTGDLRVSSQEMRDIACFRFKAGGDLASINQLVIQDILAMARSRGGTGTVKCGYDTTQTPPPPPPPPTDAAACFTGGAASLTMQEIFDTIVSGRESGRTDADIKADIESLNRARGGSGALTCLVESLVPPPPSEESRTGKCNALLQAEIAAKEEIMALMAGLEEQMYYWRQLEIMPEYRWLSYMAEVVIPTAFDPVSPSQMARLIDRKYGRPRYGDAFVRREGTNEWVDPGVIWLESDKARQAEAEKKAYEVEYAQRMERIQQARALPGGPEDIRQFYEPSRHLDEIAIMQDFYLDDYRAHDAKQDEYQQKLDTGLPCQ